jgi:hypothetical protein
MVLRESKHLLELLLLIGYDGNIALEPHDLCIKLHDLRRLLFLIVLMSIDLSEEFLDTLL